MRAVLDTNVLVSALLTPAGSPAEVLGLVLGGEICLLVSASIMAEYYEVLRRPRFGMASDYVEQLMGQLLGEAELILAPQSKAKLPDRDDEMFLACAVTGRADCIVIGNKRHFPATACRPIGVLSPAELLARYSGR